MPNRRTRRRYNLVLVCVRQTGRFLIRSMRAGGQIAEFGRLTAFLHVICLGMELEHQ